MMKNANSPDRVGPLCYNHEGNVMKNTIDGKKPRKSKKHMTSNGTVVGLFTWLNRNVLRHNTRQCRCDELIILRSDLPPQKSDYIVKTITIPADQCPPVEALLRRIFQLVQDDANSILPPKIRLYTVDAHYTKRTRRVFPYNFCASPAAFDLTKRGVIEKFIGEISKTLREIVRSSNVQTTQALTLLNLLQTHNVGNIIYQQTKEPIKTPGFCGSCDHMFACDCGAGVANYKGK